MTHGFSSGKADAYGYDALGCQSNQSVEFGGSGDKMVVSIMERWLRYHRDGFTKEQAVVAVRDALTSAAERDIYTGDGINVVVVTPEGIETHDFPLRCD